METEEIFKEHLDKLQDVNDMLRACYKKEFGSYISYCQNPVGLTLGQKTVLQNFNINYKNKIFENNAKFITKICKQKAKNNKEYFQELKQQSYIIYNKYVYHWDGNKSPLVNFLGMVLGKQLKSYKKTEVMDVFESNKSYEDFNYFEYEEMVEDLIKKAGLSKLESEVLRYYLNNKESCWQTKLAIEKNCKSQNINTAFLKALNKIRGFYD